MFGMKYSQLLRENRRLGESLAAAASPRYRAALLSNTTMAQATELVEYALREGGVNASVEIGGFDNIAQESGRLADADLVVIAWEAASVIDGFHYRAETTCSTTSVLAQTPCSGNLPRGTACSSTSTRCTPACRLSAASTVGCSARAAACTRSISSPPGQSACGRA